MSVDRQRQPTQGIPRALIIPRLALLVLLHPRLSRCSLAVRSRASASCFHPIAFARQASCRAFAANHVRRPASPISQHCCPRHGPYSLWGTDMSDLRAEVHQVANDCLAM
jgi:hypothetical protein